MSTRDEWEEKLNRLAELLSPFGVGVTSKGPNVVELEIPKPTSFSLRDYDGSKVVHAAFRKTAEETNDGFEWHNVDMKGQIVIGELPDDEVTIYCYVRRKGDKPGAEEVLLGRATLSGRLTPNIDYENNKARVELYFTGLIDSAFERRTDKDS